MAQRPTVRGHFSPGTRGLHDAIEEWEVKPVHVSLFGSAARGEGNTDSDIDLVVVRPDDISEDDPRWRRQLDDLGDQVARWTGNHAGIVEVAVSEFPKLRKRKPLIVKELLSDAIAISGPEITALLGNRR